MLETRRQATEAELSITREELPVVPNSPAAEIASVQLSRIMQGAHRTESSTSDPSQAISARTKVPSTIRKHNEVIGSVTQRFVQAVVSLCFVCPIMHVVLKLFFQFRIRGHHHLKQVEGSSILAIQHFFEWDPVIVLCGLLWHLALGDRKYLPYSLAGRFWMRQPLRSVSYAFGILGLIKGLEPLGAISSAAKLLDNGRPSTVAIYPTGPVGRSQTWQVRPGVAHLSLLAPQVPVFPISIMGLQHLSLRSVLLLKRPQLTFVVSEPIYAQDIEGDSDDHRALKICEFVQAAWSEAECEHAC